MKWNKVHYIDCMDEEMGLPSLPDNSIDLCLTDPPYNVGLRGNSQITSKQKKEHPNWKSDERSSYFDDMTPEDYENWCKNWFHHLKRICKMIILTCGNFNLAMWMRIEEPPDILFHYRRNGFGRTRICRFNKCEVILYYGKISRPYPFISNVFDIYLNNGFLRKWKLIHPCPKSYDLFFEILKSLHSINMKDNRIKSVIDPFLGSGTTAQACKSLGIPWIGYEINEAYGVDIEKRLKKARFIKKKKQKEFI